MQILGLTGPSGAGKGFVCTRFLRFGIPSIDCDAVSKSIYLPNAPCTMELAETFGKEILDAEGNLLRRKLAQIAFSAPALTKKLNAITHPHILAAVEDRISQHRASAPVALLLDAPTLFESGLHARCHRVICVTAPDSIRRNRILVRDALTQEQADTRLAAQPQAEFYRTQSDYEIVNDGILDVDGQIHAILQSLALL